MAKVISNNFRKKPKENAREYTQRTLVNHKEKNQAEDKDEI